MKQGGKRIDENRQQWNESIINPARLRRGVCREVFQEYKVLNETEQRRERGEAELLLPFFVPTLKQIPCSYWPCLVAFPTFQYTYIRSDIDAFLEPSSLNSCGLNLAPRFSICFHYWASLFNKLPFLVITPTARCLAG